jgi:hypothetical protein
MQFKPVSFTVVDTAGQPVEKALVEASVPGPGNASGNTGKDGCVTLQLVEGATLHVHVSKDGYYDTSGEIWTGGLHKGPGGRLIARVLPDAFTVRLKDVRDPVPMRRTVFRGRAPAAALHQPVGFDLDAGDWVSPLGSGSVPDILFHFHDVEVEPDAFKGTMTVSFSNEGDGIQPFSAPRPHSTEFGSNLAPPHEAPVDGYLPSIAFSLSHREGEPFQSYVQKQRHYLLRCRTRLDPAGSIRQASYGWILGEIEFDPRDSTAPQLAFTAFLNPDPDPQKRSLEPAPAP